MVSTPALICMAVTLVLCVIIPLAGIGVLARRNKQVLRAFGVGALAFFVSQMLLRIPLMSLATAFAPDTIGAFLSSVPVASFSAGLFEETARLVFMLLLLKGFHRLVDGLAFGFGHGGIEAILLVGMTMVNNLVIALMMNAGMWNSIAKSMPPEAAEQIQAVLTETPASSYLAGGVERMWAIGLHIACSLIIMMGIQRGRKFLAWLLAVLVHGCVNLGALSALRHGINTWLVELCGVLVIAALLALVIGRARMVLPTAFEQR
ncbi:YhfC family glutamic-type intramembrane protease [Corynebacterium sp. H128]|uniref:YhfC family intramembrane metalloprotease n=1 Tax=Corynebacterium sp. H128 TaxID=3133427 RepID=UPI00309B73A3